MEVLLTQGKYLLFPWQRSTFAFYAAFFSLCFFVHEGNRQSQRTQRCETCSTHEQGGPGMGKDEHGSHLGGRQMEQAGKHQYPNGFVAPDLPRRGWQDVEHVVDGVAEDG